MKPEEAQIKYDQEWPALNKEKEIVTLSGDKKAIKKVRQKLTALSIKYEDRHIKPEVKEPYPECVKLAAIAPLSQEIGNFLDESEYVLCTYEKIDEHISRYVPVHKDIQTMLAKHFDINMKLVEQERQHILDNL